MVTDTALFEFTNTKALRILKRKEKLHKGKGKFHPRTGHEGPEGE